MVLRRDVYRCFYSSLFHNPAVINNQKIWLVSWWNTHRHTTPQSVSTTAWGLIWWLGLWWSQAAVIVTALTEGCGSGLMLTYRLINENFSATVCVPPGKSACCYNSLRSIWLQSWLPLTLEMLMSCDINRSSDHCVHMSLPAACACNAICLLSILWALKGFMCYSCVCSSHIESRHCTLRCLQFQPMWSAWIFTLFAQCTSFVCHIGLIHMCLTVVSHSYLAWALLWIQVSL